MEGVMEILTFLFWRLFILKATASILGGLYLCIKGNKISTVTIQKMFSGYCGVIFGSLIMFLLNPNAILMIFGCVISYFIFFLTDKIFKNNGMFLVSFVCVMEWGYIIPTSIIFHNAERLKNSIHIISDKDRSYVEKYFMGDNYVIWDKCFFMAVLIGLIAAVVMALVVKNRKILNFMMLLIGSVQLFGSIFSVSNYFDRRVTDWEVVYIPYMNIHFENNGIYLGWSIIMTAIIFYWIQKKVDKSNNSID